MSWMSTPIYINIRKFREIFLLYARINLAETSYTELTIYKILKNPDIHQLNTIYAAYCRHKKFKSVMPIFDNEYTDPKNDVIGYYDNNKLVAFSIIRKYDAENAECIQFAWDYKTPELKLGFVSLENECAIYKKQGFKYLYLGEAAEYKKKFVGFEILGPTI